MDRTGGSGLFREWGVHKNTGPQSTDARVDKVPSTLYVAQIRALAYAALRDGAAVVRIVEGGNRCFGRPEGCVLRVILLKGRLGVDIANQGANGAKLLLWEGDRQRSPTIKFRGATRTVDSYGISTAGESLQGVKLQVGFVFHGALRDRAGFSKPTVASYSSSGQPGLSALVAHREAVQGRKNTVG